MERSVYGKQFSNANLQLCPFHILKSMRHEIHCKKMNIHLEQKNQCLEIIQKMVYSTNEEKYMKNYQTPVAYWYSASGCPSHSRIQSLIPANLTAYP